MNKVILLIAACLLPYIAFSEELPLSSWTPHWNFDPMDDSVSCSLFSNQILFKGKFGLNKMYIGVQDDDSVTLQSKKDTFDSRYISKIGIRAGKNPAIFGPEYISSRLLKFSPEKSKLIIEQLFKSQHFTVQIVFFPDGERVNKQLHLGQDFTAFQQGFNSKINCVQIKNNEGWVGIAFTDLVEIDSYIKFVRENSNFDGPGTVIWSVHPKKAGAESGLKNFDIVLGVDGNSVNKKLLLEKLVGMQSGESAVMNILRGNNFKNIELKKP